MSILRSARWPAVIVAVAACRRAKLSPPLGGRIEKIAVREGERVKRGQLLLQLWNDDLAARAW